jgi:hypothetical protein
MKKMILLFSVGMLFTSLSSCKKAGCTDIKADNYSSKVKTNDGSCVYSEKLIIWQDQAAAQSWSGLAVVLKIYVDGTYLGSFSASEYLNSTPNCDSNGQLNKMIDFGTANSKMVNVKVVDEDDYEWYNENVTMNAGNCSYYKVL